MRVPLLFWAVFSKRSAGKSQNKSFGSLFQGLLPSLHALAWPIPVHDSIDKSSLR